MGFSLVVVSGCHSLVVRGPHCSGLSCCGAWALGCAGFSALGLWALEHGLGSCGTWAQLLGGMWGTPGSGIESVFPVPAGTFFTTQLPGKPGATVF